MLGPQKLILLYFSLIGLGAICAVPLSAVQQTALEPPLKSPEPIQNESKSKVRRLAYSPKLNLLAYTIGIYAFPIEQTPSLPIYLWDLQKGHLHLKLAGHGQQIIDLAFAPEGDWLFSGAADGVIAWNPKSGVADRNKYSGRNATAVLTPSGKELLQVDSEGNVAMWNIQTSAARTLEAKKESKHGIRFFSELKLAVSRDERWIVMGGGMDNYRIVVWDGKSGRVAATLVHESELTCLGFSSTGKYLLAGGNEVRKGYWGRGVLAIWDTQSWKLIHEIEVDDYEVRPLWDLSEEGIVLSVDNLRSPVGENNSRFRTFVNGYSIKSGKRIISFDTQLPKDGYCTAALYLTGLNAVCIGGRDGRISFYSLGDVLKHKT